MRVPTAIPIYTRPHLHDPIYTALVRDRGQLADAEVPVSS